MGILSRGFWGLAGIAVIIVFGRGKPRFRRCFALPAAGLGDNDFLDPGAAGVNQAVGVCVGEGFALVLVYGHSSYFSKKYELWAQYV